MIREKDDCLFVFLKTEKTYYLEAKPRLILNL